MINYYTETQRFGYCFKEFLNLISSANVTFKREIGPIGDSQDDIKFNQTQGLHNYENALSNKYHSMGIELEKNLLDRYEKVKKLNYLSLYIAEIEACRTLLVKEKSGTFKHLNFTFLNNSEDIAYIQIALKQSDIQTYLQLMYLYTGKCESYLLSMRQNIELISQSEFPVPEHMLPRQNESSVENPIAFFDGLIGKNGLEVFKNNFIPTQEDYEYSYGRISYNPNTETITSEEQDPETGEWELYETKFATVLLQELKKEFAKSKSLMDEKIKGKVKKKEIKLFIQLTLNELKYLMSVILRTPGLKSYEDLKRVVTALILYLFERYGPYCPECDSDYKEFLQDSTIYKLKSSPVRALPQATNPGVFRWMKDSHRLSIILHTELVAGFIQNIEFDVFHSAFSGGHPEAPLRIKWINIPHNKADINKVTLLYLFKKLSEANLIDVSFESSIMEKKLEYIFVDSKGEKIKNWAQSRKSVKDSKTQTHSKQEIDRIVALLVA